MSTGGNMSNLHEKLAKIQQTLKSPKNQMNKFGGYAYRSCEDILESVKPLLQDLTLVITDEVVAVSHRIYIKATCTLSDGKTSISNSAYAREPEEKKGADAAQISGGTSSYARKYSLNGLFLIDDSKDADATNDHGKGEKIVVEDKKPVVLPKQEVKEQPQATTSFRRKKVEDGI